MRGLQGAGVPIAACVKHWVADGGTALGSGTADFAWTGTPPHLLDPNPNPNTNPNPNPNQAHRRTCSTRATRSAARPSCTRYT